MAYDEFKAKDFTALRIAENAKKFGVEMLENELLVSEFLKTKTANLSPDDKAKIEQIFTDLMQIEQDIQLSK